MYGFPLTIYGRGGMEGYESNPLTASIHAGIPLLPDA
jgi:hypothetical protein